MARKRKNSHGFEEREGGAENGKNCATGKGGGSGNLAASEGAGRGGEGFGWSDA